MKYESSRFKHPQHANKPFFKINPAEEKRLQLIKRNPKRLRIVQSVSAGRIRGGHSFH